MRLPTGSLTTSNYTRGGYSSVLLPALYFQHFFFVSPVNVRARERSGTASHKNKKSQKWISHSSFCWVWPVNVLVRNRNRSRWSIVAYLPYSLAEVSWISKKGGYTNLHAVLLFLIDLLHTYFTGVEAHGRLTHVGPGTTRIGSRTQYENGPVAGQNTGEQWICRHGTKKTSQAELTPNGQLALQWNFGAAQ